MREGFIVHAQHKSPQLLYFRKNKMAVLVKNFFFQNYGPNFYLKKKLFTAQSSTNIAQLSTTFFFSKKQNGRAGKKKFFFKILALIFTFLKNRLQHNLAQILFF